MKLFAYLVSHHGMNINKLCSISGVHGDLLEAHYCYGKPLRKNYKMQVERAMFKYLLLMGDTSEELKDILCAS